MLPRRASGCVGCRRRENTLIRITGFEITRLDGSNTACERLNYKLKRDRGGIKAFMKGMSPYRPA